MKLKCTYYVAIIRGNDVEYVTSLDNATKTFLCEKGKPAKKFSKTQADDLMLGMTANFCPAAVIKVPESRILKNKE